MALRDLFAPKWKHSRVDVRLKAVEAVCKDQAILKEIATTDSSPQVRIAALKLIEGDQFLESIIQTEKDALVLETAKKQREAFLKKIIASSDDQKQVISALEKYGNEKVTATYLCDHNLDISTQRTLVVMIKSNQLLAKITEHECAFEIAEQIVSQINEKEYLERIAQKASNKKIRTIAQEKIDKLFADPLAEEREITRKLKLCCTGMDIEVTPQNYSQAVDLLEISRNMWNKYDPQRTHPLAETFAAAENVLVDKISKAEAQKELLETLQHICKNIELLADGSEETIENDFKELQRQWNAIDRAIIGDLLTVSLDERYETACAKVVSVINAIKSSREQEQTQRELQEQACRELELFVDSTSATDEKTWQRLLEHWNAVCLEQTPSDTLIKRVTDVKTKYNELISEKQQLIQSEQQDEIDTIESLFQKMESLAQTPPMKIRSRYLQVLHLRKEWDKPRPLARSRKEELQSAFTSSFETFMNLYREQKEQHSWEQWANEHAKARLLDEFEQLEKGLQQSDSLKKIARKISLFESQWRRASGGERETTELDGRFSEIRARIFTLALAKKSELLDTLKNVLEQAEDSKQAEEVKALQKQWNDIGYLPPELEKELPDTFYSLCNTYFEQRKEQYQKYTEEIEKNCKIREEICIEAEKLAGSTDWKLTKEAFAQLQKQWDESWPAPHKKSQELWLQFSKYRDLFFENYHSFQAENDKRKEALCADAEQLLARLNVNESESSADETATETGASDLISDSENTDNVDGDAVQGESNSDNGSVEISNITHIDYRDILNSAVTLQKSWKECGPGTKEHSDELWERFNGTLRNVFALIDEEHRKNYQLKENLVREAESLALSDDWNATSIRFQEIRDTWKSIGQASRHDEQVLWKRLQAAGDTFFGRRRAHFDSRRNVIRQSIEVKERLIAEMEILVRIAGKGRLIKTAQNQNAAEVLKKGIELSNQLVVDGDPEKTYNNIRKRVLEIIDIWESGDQFKGKDFYELDKRFGRMLDILKQR